MSNAQQIQVWDPLIRFFHWSIVILVCLNLFILEEGEAPHRYVGYSVGILLLVRLLWGFIGSRYARFSQWWPKKDSVLSYVNQLKQRQHPYYLGHNPLGALMILALLLGLAGTVLSGWMTTWDAFWGDDWLKEVHGVFANALMLAAGIHAAAVLLTDKLTDHGLLKAMLSGRKQLTEGITVEDRD